MLVCAVPDPSAFDVRYFDNYYMVNAEDFLKGIKTNGLLIVDKSEKRLQDALIKKINDIPDKYGKQLRILLEELLKNRKKRIVELNLTQKSSSSRDLLNLAYQLKIEACPDALIVGDDSLKTLKSEQKYGADIVPLSEYRDSVFEAERQRNENKIGPIDTLPKTDIDNLIIRSVRFAKWLRFYDPYIGKGNNTVHFRKGIEYILSLWRDNGFFASQQGIGDVRIYTCSVEQIRDDETLDAKKSKFERNQEGYRETNMKLIDPLNDQFPWPIQLYVKRDPDDIFHARFLETQHAIIGIERGFDLFKRNSRIKLKRNFLTLMMDANTHLKECRELPNANIGNSS